jgi:hypothetical protein
MDLSPIHIVDTLAVAPSDHLAMLELLRGEGVPTLRRAGLQLVSCRSTSPDLGEEVLIQLTWAVADHAQYNQVRFAFVTDPAWREFSDKARKLRRGGTRRFYYPSPIEMGE